MYAAGYSSFLSPVLLVVKRWAGSERRVSNFADDLADGICYMMLIKVSRN